MTRTSSQIMATRLAKTENPASTTQTAPLSPRMRIARLILIYHFILLAAACVYYLLRGFDLEEFTSLIGILGPITALYGGAVFRFIGRTITEPGASNGSSIPVNNLVKLLVHGHFAIVLLLISTKALAPNILNFQDMTMFLTFVESAIGVYMGSIILGLFEGKVKEG
jgi:hypothetical protein